MSDMEKGHKEALATELLQRRLASHQDFVRTATVTRATEALADDRLFRWEWSGLNNSLFRSETGGALAHEIGARYLPVGLLDTFRPRLGRREDTLYPPVWRNWLSRELLRLFIEEESALIRAVLSDSLPDQVAGEVIRPSGSPAPEKRLQALIQAVEQESPGLTAVLREEARRKVLRGLPREKARSARGRLAALPVHSVVPVKQVGAQKRGSELLKSPYPGRLGVGGVFRTLLSAAPVSVDEAAEYRDPEEHRTGGDSSGINGTRAPFIWIEGVGLDKAALPALTAGLRGWSGVIHRTAPDKGERRRAGQFARSLYERKEALTATPYGRGLIPGGSPPVLLQVTGEGVERVPGQRPPGSSGDGVLPSPAVHDVTVDGSPGAADLRVSLERGAQEPLRSTASSISGDAVTPILTELQLSELVSGPQYDMSSGEPVHVFTQPRKITGDSPDKGSGESPHRAWRQFSPEKALSLSLLSGSGLSVPAMVALDLSQQREAFSGRKFELGSASLEGRAALSDWIDEAGERRWQQRALTPFGAVTIDRSFGSVKAMRQPSVPGVTHVQLMAEQKQSEQIFTAWPGEEPLGRPAVRAIKSAEAAPLALISSANPGSQIRLSLKEPTALLMGATTLMSPADHAESRRADLSVPFRHGESGPVFAGIRAHMGGFPEENRGADLDLRGYFQAASSPGSVMGQRAGYGLKDERLTRPELVLMVSEREGGTVAQSLGQVPPQPVAGFGAGSPPGPVSRSMPLSIAAQSGLKVAGAAQRMSRSSLFSAPDLAEPGSFSREIASFDRLLRKQTEENRSAEVPTLTADLWIGQMVDRATRLTNQGMAEIKAGGGPSTMTTLSLGQMMGLAEEVSLSSPAGAKSIERALLPLIVRVDSAVRAGEMEATQGGKGGAFASDERSPQPMESRALDLVTPEIPGHPSPVSIPVETFRALPEIRKKNAVWDYHSQVAGLGGTTDRVVGQLFQPLPPAAKTYKMSATDQAITRSVRGLLHPVTGQPRLLGVSSISPETGRRGKTFAEAHDAAATRQGASGERAGFSELVHALRPSLELDLATGATAQRPQETAVISTLGSSSRPRRRKQKTLNTLSGLISQVMGEGVGRSPLLRRSPTALALAGDDEGRFLVHSGQPSAGSQETFVPPLLRSIKQGGQGALSPSEAAPFTQKPSDHQAITAFKPLSYVGATEAAPPADTERPSLPSPAGREALTHISAGATGSGAVSEEGWVDKEIGRLLSSISHINMAQREPVPLRTRSESAARALLSYLELSPQRPKATRQTGKTATQAAQRPEIVEDAPIRVRRSETRLGRALLSSREMSAASSSIQGQAKAVGREYVAPAGLSPAAPGLAPLARVSQQTGGQEAERADLAEDGAAPPEENIVQMAEEVYGIIKGRMEEEASRFGR